MRIAAFLLIALAAAVAVVALSFVMAVPSAQDPGAPPQFLHIQTEEAGAEPGSLTLPVGAVGALLAMAPNAITENGQIQLGSGQGLPIDALRSLWAEVQSTSGPVTAEHDGTAATISVTETGSPSGGAARSGPFATQSDGPRPIAGWTGARFRRGATAEHLVVHADPGAPEAAAFTPENLNRLNEVSELTGETVPASGLEILDTWWPVIRSTSLAVAPPGGSTIYRAEGTGADAGREFVGTFAGGTGRFRCSGGNCSVTLNDKGMPTAMGGDWTFAPDSGAMVMVPDYDHLYFGWWLSEAQDAAWGFQTFAGGVGFPNGVGKVTAAMEGTATYRGVAGGVWAQTDVSGGRVTAASSGEFTAEAELIANFFGAQDTGAVSGRIDSFRDGAGKSLDGWRVTLVTAPLTVGEVSFAGRTGGAVGSGTSGEGHWEGRFHGTDGADTNARPSHVTGRFDLHFPGAHLAGAFGAGR